MILIMTGEIQTGKTRWLEALVDDLDARGISVYGMLSPGVWRDRAAEEAEGVESFDGAQTGRYEKLGIEAVLYPSRERLPFARRADLAAAKGSADPRSQAARAGLGWAIDDAALSRANDHFDSLAAQADAALREAPFMRKPGLLVVDEWGRLELERREGLAASVSLIERGPTSLWQHAIIVARAALSSRACERLEASADSWAGLRVAAPGDEARALILALYSTTTASDPHAS